MGREILFIDSLSGSGDTSEACIGPVGVLPQPELPDPIVTDADYVGGAVVLQAGEAGQPYPLNPTQVIDAGGENTVLTNTLISLPLR